MKRSQLKNIINKSKELSAKGSSFDQFKKSLPINIDDNYRLEAAWKAYGSPKDFKSAVWEGLIQPIDENNYKLPSIGYNEKTDEYEYLNKGQDNEIVNKDIRVWDNDVIPFVKELKQGGFIRIYDEEKDCWKYSKNQSQDIESFKSGGKKKIRIKTHEDTYIELDSLTEDQRMGRTPVGKNSKGQNLYLGEDGIAAPLNHMPGKQENGGIIDSFQKGGKSSKKEKNDYTYAEFIATLPSNLQKGNDGENGYRMRYAFDNSPDVWTFDDAKGKFIDWNENDQSWHGVSVFDQTGEFLKPANHSTTWMEEAAYMSSKPKLIEGKEDNGDPENYVVVPMTGKEKESMDNFRSRFNLVKTDENGNLLKYWKYVPKQSTQAFKQGGQMNVIPAGALHARKNNMEGAGEDFTAKGIPVISNDGEQVAEIERNEVIFNKEVTDFIEENYKKFKSEETSNSEKDEIAIKVGKRLVKELLENTEDRTGLIQEVQEKM